MEIDTTLLFNSALKVSKSVNSVGGIIEFDPGFSYVDSTVYYWHVALKPASGLASDYHWNNASFIYIANSSPGSNQSHYYQHLYSDTQNITLDSSRQWNLLQSPMLSMLKGWNFPYGCKLGLRICSRCKWCSVCTKRLWRFRYYF